MIKIDSIVRNIKDIYGLVDLVNSIYHNEKFYDDYSSVMIVVKYNEARAVIQNLISEYGYEIANINLDAPETNGYSDEYIISLSMDKIDCEPAKENEKYKDIYGDVVCIFEDCNSRIIPHIYGDVIVEVYKDENYDDEDDCDENCSVGDDTYLHISEDKDGVPHGFTVSKSNGDEYTSYSYYSSNVIDCDNIKSMLEAFGF